MLVSFEDAFPVHCSEVSFETVYITDSMLKDMVCVRTHDLRQIPSGYLGSFPAQQWNQILDEMNNAFREELELSQQQLSDKLADAKSDEKSVTLFAERAKLLRETAPLLQVPKLPLGQALSNRPVAPSELLRKNICDDRVTSEQLQDQQQMRRRHRQQLAEDSIEPAFGRLLPSEEDIRQILAGEDLQPQVNPYEGVQPTEFNLFKTDEEILRENEQARMAERIAKLHSLSTHAHHHLEDSALLPPRDITRVLQESAERDPVAVIRADHLEQLDIQQDPNNQNEVRGFIARDEEVQIVIRGKTTLPGREMQIESVRATPAKSPKKPDQPRTQSFRTMKIRGRLQEATQAVTQSIQVHNQIHNQIQEESRADAFLDSLRAKLREVSLAERIERAETIGFSAISDTQRDSVIEKLAAQRNAQKTAQKKAQLHKAKHASANANKVLKKLSVVSSAASLPKKSTSSTSNTSNTVSKLPSISATVDEGKEPVNKTLSASLHAADEVTMSRDDATEKEQSATAIPTSFTYSLQIVMLVESRRIMQVGDQLFITSSHRLIIKYSLLVVLHQEVRAVGSCGECPCQSRRCAIVLARDAWDLRPHLDQLPRYCQAQTDDRRLDRLR